jgi:hypothetical protein
MPDSETRRVIVELFESMRSRLKSSAIVLEKSGVDGAMSRAVLSTLVTISRRPFDMKIFSNRDAAATCSLGKAAPTRGSSSPLSDNWRGDSRGAPEDRSLVPPNGSLVPANGTLAAASGPTFSQTVARCRHLVDSIRHYGHYILHASSDRAS